MTGGRAVVGGTIAAILVLGACAHGRTIVLTHGAPRDEAALAAAVAWLIRATPAALHTVQVGDDPASVDFMALVLSTAYPTSVPSVGPSQEPRLPGTVHVRAAEPVWATPDRATVALSYAWEDRVPVHCSVSVLAVGAGERRWQVSSKNCAGLQKEGS